MSKRKKEKKKDRKGSSEKDDLGFSLNEKTKRSISIVLLFILSLVSLLGLFKLSGQTGEFISQNLGLIFGLGKWLVPVLLLFWAVLLLKDKVVELVLSDYLGLILFFLSYQTIFHFFIKPGLWAQRASEGLGGGFIGYQLSRGLSYAFGFWGGLIILIGLFLVSLLISFNTSLSKLIGQESYFAGFYRSISSLYSNLFKKKDLEGEEEEEGDEEYEEEEAEDELPLADWESKSLGEKEDPNLSNSLSLTQKRIQEASASRAQDTIKWPKKKIKIDLPIELLNPQSGQAMGDNVDINTNKIKRTLENFGISVEMAGAKIGPTVTQYTFKPAEGVKVSRIITLNNDLSLALAAHPIRIEAPIPGQSLVGIEVPNKTKAIVGLREILEDPVFKKRKHNMMLILGRDVAGTAWIYDITRMPHLLVAGATNSGKSVCLNTIIISLLYQNSPSDLRFIMVDPKRVELPAYNGIPHLLTPVITEVSKTINALKWCLNEMDRRYDILNKAGKRNIQSYNQENPKEKLPYIIFIIDELADFMMTSGKEMEAAIIRLAQMSRAVGIHLILATQRPSVDVITGLIKANIPTRIAFSVASLVDSKTILDMSGAEKLLGQGDMLFSSAELAKPKRIQGAFLSDQEINDIINYIKEKSGEAEYLEGVTDRQRVAGIAGVGLDGTRGDEDELMDEAIDLVIKSGKASTSLLQRRLSIGYGRAAKILDMLEEAGVVGPSQGSRPREILINSEDANRLGAMGLSGFALHKQRDSEARDSYLSPEENGEDDDDSLDLSRLEEVEVKESESGEDDAPDFLKDDDGPEDEIETEQEIFSKIDGQQGETAKEGDRAKESNSEDALNEEGKEDRKEEEDGNKDSLDKVEQVKESKARVFDEDDGIFFSR